MVKTTTKKRGVSHRTGVEKEGHGQNKIQKWASGSHTGWSLNKGTTRNEGRRTRVHQVNDLSIPCSYSVPAPDRSIVVISPPWLNQRKIAVRKDASLLLLW